MRNWTWQLRTSKGVATSLRHANNFKNHKTLTYLVPRMNPEKAIVVSEFCQLGSTLPFILPKRAYCRPIKT